MTSQSTLRESVALQESLKCLLSPGLAIPVIVAYVVRFYDPHSRQYKLVKQILDPQLQQTSAGLKQLEETIEAVLPAASSGPFKMSQGNAHSAQWLYPVALPGLPAENHLFAITNTLLIPSQANYLQAIAEAIANHLKVWQQQHSYQTKTAELEEILGSVEHQVRQSVGLVNLYLSLLEGQPLDAQGQTVTDNLRTTVSEIVDRLTTILGPQESPINALPLVDLRQLVSDRGRAFKPSLQAKQLTLELPSETAWLQTDPHQMGQVIDNLLCNAIAFSPQGGVIEWTWDVFDSEVLMQITAQGPGMPPSAMRAIFQPGYTQRPQGQGQGQGLGLAIINKIVREHGGRVWANNLTRGGAQFSVIFPQTQILQSGLSPSLPPEQLPECDYSRAAC
mgnify:CR=1 FL=1